MKRIGDNIKNHVTEADLGKSRMERTGWECKQWHVLRLFKNILQYHKYFITYKFTYNLCGTCGAPGGDFKTLELSSRKCNYCIQDWK
jgi:hypothetical protein